MTVMGYKRNDFTTKDGNHVTGYNLFLGYPISGADSDGMAVERLYFSAGISSFSVFHTDGTSMAP